MNPVAFVKRRPVTTLTLVVALAGGGAYGLYRTRVEIPRLHTALLYAALDQLGVRAKQTRERLVGRHGPKAQAHGGQHHGGEHKVVVTRPEAKDLTLTQQYVCQIHSQRHINVCALESGFLEKVLVKEGQAVRKGDLIFKIVPTLYQAKLDAELAEAQLAQLEFNNTKKLFEQNVVSQNEVALLQAKLARAQAKAQLAVAELNFTNVTAPFDGIVDRIQQQLGSLIKEGDVLTTLSDNSVMWVYFNVPEARYLEYMAGRDQNKEDDRIELVLANGNTFQHTGKIGAIEAKFNNETGNIPFRADFPNPEGLLRHGQTGTVVVHRVLKDAIVIPQRATFEILAKRYAYVVDGHHSADDDDDDDDNADDHHGVVHQREVVIQNEMEDIFVIKKGLDANDKIVLEGIRQVRDGDQVEYQFLAPKQALDHLKFHAE